MPDRNELAKKGKSMNREEFEKIRDQKIEELKEKCIKEVGIRFDKLTEEQNNLICEKFNHLAEIAYQAGKEAAKKDAETSI